MVTKINKIVGIDFIVYCKQILQVNLDKNLTNLI
jgi:hypothetical protein